LIVLVRDLELHRTDTLRWGKMERNTYRSFAEMLASSAKEKRVLSEQFSQGEVGRRFDQFMHFARDETMVLSFGSMVDIFVYTSQRLRLAMSEDELTSLSEFNVYELSSEESESDTAPSQILAAPPARVTREGKILRRGYRSEGFVEEYVRCGLTAFAQDFYGSYTERIDLYSFSKACSVLGMDFFRRHEDALNERAARGEFAPHCDIGPVLEKGRAIAIRPGVFRRSELP
jgi:hypothetical protein